MARSDPFIVGLDVGTTKVCAVIGEPTADGALEIIGVGVAESHGQKKGSVVDVDSTVERLKASIEEAALLAGACIVNDVSGPRAYRIRRKL